MDASFPRHTNGLQARSREQSVEDLHIGQCGGLIKHVTLVREVETEFVHWLGVVGVREILIHIREHTVQNRDWRAARTLQTVERTRMARSFWAPGSFWGLRYPSKRDDT